MLQDISSHRCNRMAHVQKHEYHAHAEHWNILKVSLDRHKCFALQVCSLPIMSNPGPKAMGRPCAFGQRKRGQVAGL